ncbi:MAG TPA: nucleotidyl transferase AbiEii/AbiGii toxin family protein [Chitinophagaceae bacterium]|nr:nucleotidyl transferase AbiEii/AbiGii toxin family protein [Chitinophagaceae bacterium]
MLHKDPFIIAPETFRLVQQLQAIPELKEFHLVGGTALSLQLGHRNSIDIDLFTKNEFEATDIINLLQADFSVTATLVRKGTLLAVVNNIKTDFIQHSYPLIKPPFAEEGISFLSKEDIAGMKFHAVIQSGKRLKDFIDMYFLLEHFSMKQMLEFYSAKYTFSNPMIAMKAINFFDDIDENIDPPKLLKPLSVKKITERIQEATVRPDKIFKQE